MIENCPNLKLVYDYKSGEGKKVPTKGRQYNEETDNPFNQKNQQITSEDWVQAELKKRIKEFIKDTLILVEDIEKDANQGHWDSVQTKITKLKSWLEQYSLTEEESKEITTRIKDLEARMLTQTRVIEGKNQWPELIVGSLVILPLVLGIIYWLASRWVRWDLGRKVNSDSESK